MPAGKHGNHQSFLTTRALTSGCERRPTKGKPALAATRLAPQHVTPPAMRGPAREQDVGLERAKRMPRPASGWHSVAAAPGWQGHPTWRAKPLANISLSAPTRTPHSPRRTLSSGRMPPETAFVCGNCRLPYAPPRPRLPAFPPTARCRASGGYPCLRPSRALPCSPCSTR
jgi:hypothetical protein